MRKSLIGTTPAPASIGEQIGAVGNRQGRICVVVIVAVIAAAAATVAWSRLRLDGPRRAPDIIDLVVVLMVSSTAAVTVSGPAL